MQEPLPQKSELWNLPNVLISPHNADAVASLRGKAVELFAELCQLYLESGTEDLFNVVDLSDGY